MKEAKRTIAAHQVEAPEGTLNFLEEVSDRLLALSAASDNQDAAICATNILLCFILDDMANRDATVIERCTAELQRQAEQAIESIERKRALRQLAEFIRKAIE